MLSPSSPGRWELTALARPACSPLEGRGQREPCSGCHLVQVLPLPLPAEWPLNTQGARDMGVEPPGRRCWVKLIAGPWVLAFVGNNGVSAGGLPTPRPLCPCMSRENFTETEGPCLIQRSGISPHRRPSLHPASIYLSAGWAFPEDASGRLKGALGKDSSAQEAALSCFSPPGGYPVPPPPAPLVTPSPDKSSSSQSPGSWDPPRSQTLFLFQEE